MPVDTVLLMDTGRPPPLALSQEAHAGCLSFELSWKQHRLVVNCGLPVVNRETWRQVARATPAHSTVTFNDAILLPLPRIRLSAPPARRHRRSSAVRTTSRSTAKARPTAPSCAPRMTATPTHSASFTPRLVRLSADGRALDGEDSFTAAAGQTIGARTTNTPIRFHLHPSVKASRLSEGRGVILLLPDREVWTFATLADAVELEESVFLSGSDGPRRAMQIVIYGRAAETGKVRWSFRHTPPAPPGTRAARPDEPELPL